MPTNPHVLRWPRVVVAAVSLAACDDVPRADGGGGGAGGSGGGGQDGGGGAEPAVYVSFVAEEGPGNGPAMLRMFNDTPAQILSLTLPTGEAFTFYLVESNTVTEYGLVASDDMVEDAVLSLHTLDTCVRRPFDAVHGPTSLEPGRAYGIHVSLEDGYVATIEEEATPAPYVGIRAVIGGFASPTLANPGAASTLHLATAAGELSFDDTYDDLPAPFIPHDPAAAEIERVWLVDGEGVERSAEGPFALTGALGFTAYVSDAPVPGAAVAVPLVE